MHLLVRETRTLDEAAAAEDLGHDPADLVLLSFSDGDLAAAAAAWEAMPAPSRPSLRLASLARLRHPMSVDLYAESVLSRARCVVVRLLGGLDYWRYGAEEAAALCRRRRIPLALLPGDGADDERLRDLSTVAPAYRSRLAALLRAGGPGNLAAALRLAAHLAGLGPDDAAEPAPQPEFGLYDPADAAPAASTGMPDDAPAATPAAASVAAFAAGSVPDPAAAPVAAIVFYRSHLAAGDTAPVAALATALRARGLAPRALFVGSLKDPAAARFAADTLRAWRPAVVLNLTGFSARRDDASGSPLDAADAPVLQPVLAGSAREAWAASPRGLTAADLAMQVVLPELDGRLPAPAIAFKAESDPIPGLDHARTVLRPDPDGIALTADRAAGWARLVGTPRSARRLALVLSDYPGAQGPGTQGPSAQGPSAQGPSAQGPSAQGPRTQGPGVRGADVQCPGDAGLGTPATDAAPATGGQVGHAVGLDSFASLAAILGTLRAAGYDTGAPAGDRAAPGPDRATMPDAAALTHALALAPPAPTLSLARYRALFATLPTALRDAVTAAWGEPDADPACADGAFRHRHLALGRLTLAVQPDRGTAADRRASYHDPDLPPRHAYLAFYLWLRDEAGIHAMLHLGTHGTLEWLPGKATALSADCAPAALAGGLPVVYPFIVNNPGEAAIARRRLGAVTIGHLTPPLRAAGSHGEAATLEHLLDEYAAADGLDRRRAALLRREILDRAAGSGLLDECGATPDLPDIDALAKLDAWLCDVKELQIRDGLHVFGTPPAPERRAALLDALRRTSPAVPPETLAARLDACAGAERAALLAALDGRFVAPGPSGAPSRGRADVLPTGRNLTGIDPRAVPTRSALVLAERAAAELLRRHRQDHGEWPRALVLDLWGSATLRTGGEELALALLLLGVRPVWDEGSARVSGIEVLPLAVLDRPRVDVTLRVSGLFRDAFPAQIALFDGAVRAVAARDEAPEWNPLAAAARGLDGEALRRATTRVYGAAPGQYGTGLEDALRRAAPEGDTSRDALGAAYLAGSAAAYGQGLDGAPDPAGFAARVAAADAFLHVQDHAETDLLEGPGHAAHEGGFAAAAASLGGAPTLYHADTSRPDAPRARTLAEEIARVARGRAANPAWLAGQMRHGYRGAANIALALEGLHAFAATAPLRLDRQFDLLFDATLGDAAVDRFLRERNPDAHAAMRGRFAEVLRRGLWRPRRNAVAEALGG
ncbi:cobaltochelatase subunit CobN [Roseomonas sp. NAR14]|uniref:Cobaltochelatase subunit CobN n=1 Tax=Roseomonas acroporae TaxID=2937791 RepID=A0A9X1YA65_9PROT|nr:cobaltochelatase subunit CobN [Roseomonas acroporae]MCK8785210.1 cobaltochelatase subunit CobN [Roseomonas acroporae]